AFKERMARPVTLAQIKADADFKQFDLVRNSRLSVMPVPAGLWKKIMAMSKRSQ
ncbi:MAG: EVE domain-containing protein, partial [Planctomycetes bacterium]|nr:EVE domain-containing protein [Planctomycetota bacterium]